MKTTLVDVSEGHVIGDGYRRTPDVEKLILRQRDLQMVGVDIVVVDHHGFGVGIAEHENSRPFVWRCSTANAIYGPGRYRRRRFARAARSPRRVKIAEFRVVDIS